MGGFFVDASEDIRLSWIKEGEKQRNLGDGSEDSPNTAMLLELRATQEEMATATLDGNPMF